MGKRKRNFANVCASQPELRKTRRSRSPKPPIDDSPTTATIERNLLLAAAHENRRVPPFFPTLHMFETCGFLPTIEETKNRLKFFAIFSTFPGSREAKIDRNYCSFQAYLRQRGDVKWIPNSGITVTIYIKLSKNSPSRSWWKRLYPRCRK